MNTSDHNGHRQPSHKPRTFLAAVGDSNSPVTWSGIPYHFLQAARAQGLIDVGLPLSTDGLSWQARRIGWNLRRVMSGERRGGYQYSRAFLERLWSPSLHHIKDNVVINCFQLYPPSVVCDRTIRKWFFIDQTLLQLFDYYGLRAQLGRRIVEEALGRELEGYQAAAGVIVHSRWVARCLAEEYALPEDRIRVVLPGANIDPAAYARWELEEQVMRAHGRKESRPLSLIFVGKDWRRKGLDRLLGALSLARKSGGRMTLKVIGCGREALPEHLRATEGVEWVGFINKRAEADRFLRTVADADAGCLLSRAEAGGIAFREYHALGLAVIGTDTGGAPEHMLPQASVMVSPDATPDEIAATLLELERDETRLAALRDAAWSLRHTVSWAETVRRIASFWPYPKTDGMSEQGLLTRELTPAAR
jgi:glycosyltransferase involved in cell wall biosynthesis